MTAFTVGHAISLCLAYFDVISVPAAVVEPAISLSIVAAAVLVMRGRSDEAPALDRGPDRSGPRAGLRLEPRQPRRGHLPASAALAAFNVGIDVAQTAVVLMIVAALWFASKGLVDRMAWVRIPTAALAAVIGLAWTASRLTGVAA